MTFSLITFVVVTSNTLMAIISATLLMLVLWQAPGRRMNQLFALTISMLMAYGVANALGRFIGDMGWNPNHASYVAITFYGLFNITIFWFAAEFAQSRSLATRFLYLFGAMFIVVNLITLWSDMLLVNIEPTGANDGSYAGEWTTFGLIVVGIQVVYQLFSAIVIYNMPDERGRALWKAPVWVIIGMIYSAVIWPLVQIPVQAVFLVFAALALGLPVLRFELFNPQAQRKAKLAATGRELLEMSRLKTQFLRNMSHELRTPLNSIIGYTQLIMNATYGDLNDTQADRLEKVIRNGNNLLGLINDVLDLNSIETGGIQLEWHEIATTTILDHVLDNLEIQASRKKLTLVRAFDGVPTIQSDETRLYQIITNIVANAIKFTDEGSVTVRASQVDDQHIQIEVEDTGVGIPRDQWDTVFEEFGQVDDSLTKRHEGTGLGMAITKRLVDLHGGHIGLDSVVSQGTTFFVKLPIKPPQSQAEYDSPVETSVWTAGKA